MSKKGIAFIGCDADLYFVWDKLKSSNKMAWIVQRPGEGYVGRMNSDRKIYFCRTPQQVVSAQNVRFVFVGGKANCKKNMRLYFFESIERIINNRK